MAVRHRKRWWRKRWWPAQWIGAAAIAAAVAVSATVLHAALPPEPDTSGRTSLAGELLIASPQLNGSFFAQAVILMAQHNREGAFGIVLNHPLDRRPIADLLTASGADARGITDSVQVFLGGPVSPDVGFVVHSADYRAAGTMDIDGRVAVSLGAEVLRDIGLGKGPRKSLVAFGYAGWGPQQLDGEIAQGGWYSVAEDPALVFDDDRAKVWADAMARHNRQP